MNKSALIVFFLLVPFLSGAQSFKSNNDFSILKSSLGSGYNSFNPIKKDTVISLTHKKHSPKKASIMSAVIPGLGQAYNEKYWKIPVVYAGLIGTGWFMLTNRKNMRERQDALIAMLDGDSSTNPSAKYTGISEAQLRADRNYYRANRDYAIIGIGLVYVLNIIDATVDAHFYNFNIDKPLAQQRTRHLYFSSSQVRNVPTIGLAYRF